MIALHLLYLLEKFRPSGPGGHMPDPHSIAPFLHSRAMCSGEALPDIALLHRASAHARLVFAARPLDEHPLRLFFSVFFRLIALVKLLETRATAISPFNESNSFCCPICPFGKIAFLHPRAKDHPVVRFRNTSRELF